MFELKPLPDNLKYAYLDEKKIYPVIISANLSEHEEERLLKTPKKHRVAIGYTLDDLMFRSYMHIITPLIMNMNMLCE